MVAIPIGTLYQSHGHIPGALHEILYEHHNQQAWCFIKVHIAYPFG